MEKPISDKQFVRKASSARVSAMAFLDAYEEHIRATYPGAVVAIDLYRKGEMLPTPALEFVKQVAGQHILEGMVNRAEESIKKSQERTEKKPSGSRSGSVGQGKYTCQLFCKVTNERTGESITELWTDHNGHHTFRAEVFQDALRLVDRKQVDLGNGQYATISQELPGGKILTTNVSRDDSVGRVLKVARGPVCKVKPTSAPLKQTMSVHNYVATFSRG